MVILSTILVLLSAVSLFVGVSNITPTDLLTMNHDAWHTITTSRLPRLLAVVLAGAGISIAGLVMQQISQNKFAAPSTAGTIECALLGYVLSLVIFGHGNALWLVFACALVGTFVFVQLIYRIKFKNAVLVPLIGIIFGNVIESIATFFALKYDVLHNVQGWGVANFANILQGDYELLYIAVPVAILSYAYSSRISAVGMGKEFAINLGLNYQQVAFIGVTLVAITSASVVMIAGKLPFLGLIVPNLVSAAYGDNLRRNIPLTAMLGAIIVLGCDIVGRLVIFPYELSVSMVISVLGGGLFLYLITRRGSHV
ncbi:iron chelate uptake ABC transporter family permease subunit [Vibrio sp. SCSIO 43136]|uniref:ABC transporter permease n=1 Tax=Vibrio sp. SCSIO 43136 TaxID=2819101 RepID=UPI0020751862|nr:iron chelate uptake ABC transporter family permease subunit [Vibrio sp. SCSIO 43136]USD63995.1 iron chelate uptake ABC transporter family permease subunit [Vibrio sp. SCSIO 43136]